MCTNRTRITNPYTHRDLYIKCGHCPSCLQEKATKLSYRLKQSSCRVWYFLTLTYKNEYLPYIRKSDLLSPSFDGIVPVYRDGEVRRVYVGNRKGVRHYANRFYPSACHIIDHCRFDLSSEYRNHAFVSGLNHLRKPVRHRVKDSVGVCYFKDGQDFIKRFKVNVERFLNKTCTNEDNRFFLCSEYGEDTHRPHLHVLLASDNLSLEDVKFALVKSWPYADFRKLRKYCEIAVDAASYVASYVNCADSISSLLAYSSFRPKHSFSQGLGMDDPNFDYSKVLEKIRKGDLSYPCKRVKDGIATYVDVPIPSYVLNRYFPYIKGFASLPLDTIKRLVESPTALYSYGITRLGFKVDERLRNLSFLGSSVESSSSFYKSVVVNQPRDFSARLLHCYHRVSKELSNYTPDRYAIDYCEFLKCVGRQKFRYFYDDIMKKQKVPQVRCYDNIIDLVSGDVSNESLFAMVDLDNDCQLITDPNQFPENIKTTLKNEHWFGVYSKYHKLTNQMMASQGHDV